MKPPYIPGVKPPEKIFVRTWRDTLENVVIVASLALIVVGLMLIFPTSALGVVEYGSDYIIWETTNETQVVIDGNIVNVTTNIYGQYGLTGGTSHYISNIAGTEGYKVVTTHDLWSIVSYWGPLLLLYFLAIVAYQWPISTMPSLAYFIFMLMVHLPSIHAEPLIYILEAVGMIVCVIAAITKSLGGS